ncbi:MAG: DUF2235 domain-containing protein [Isosphaeraceae bacterium]
MKRIVLCFDGTWSKPADEALPADEQVETNISRFFKSVSQAGDDGIVQVAWYNAGVGTRWFDHLAGGVLGAGLDEHIVSGYRYLVETYYEGDEVYILGFSRGAYAARSLVGMIRNCGLVSSSIAAWKVGMAYGIYRTREDGPDSSAARAFRSYFSREIPIKFLGVWDTVGALGIPLHLVSQLNMKFYEFHDTQLSHIVENAYQAIALDEHREDFKVTLWDPVEAPSQTVEQRWFVGDHSDVGGGHLDHELSDITLNWMQEKAAGVGLALETVAPGDASWRGTLHDSYTEFLGGLYAQNRPPYIRPVLSTQFGAEILDPTINLRRAAISTYRPSNLNLPPIT